MVNSKKYNIYPNFNRYGLELSPVPDLIEILDLRKRVGLTPLYPRGGKAFELPS